MSKLTYQLAADLTLLLHTLFVLFVVLGLVLVLLGAARGWAWVRNPVFRWSHLAAIAVVVGQAWLGVICPLTSLEMYFRARAGDVVYAGSFIAHWLEAVLYYDAPGWVFVLVYSLFAIAVLWCWFAVPPIRNREG
jgi:hypothetical protein